MTFRDFLAGRRAGRRARKADRAMRLVFGAAWDANREGVYDLLTAPAPLVVLDVGMLRGVVAEALAGSAATEVEEFGETFEDEALAVNAAAVTRLLTEAESAAETFVEEPAADVLDEPVVESPREESIFEERSNGVEAVPVRLDVNDDDKRRAFVRSFLQEQRAARGPVIPTR